MNEDTEFFKEMKEAGRNKRERNRSTSPKVLEKADIPFESKNGGVHLIVNSWVDVDFWPGTGLWIARNGHRGRGVKNLIEYLEGNP